jgi:hypothetical protein
MQGYLFSPPKPAADIRPLLLTHQEYPETACRGRAGTRKPLAHRT